MATFATCHACFAMMKRTLLSGVAGLGIWAALALPGRADEPAATRPVANATNQFTLRGMHCEGCAKGISGELKALKGVVRVEVSYPRKRARVAYDTNLVDVAAMVAVIKDAGYEAALVQGRAARP